LRTSQVIKHFPKNHQDQLQTAKLLPIDKELYDGLQQARKKKPRYFALITKGSDVVGLIVQKKTLNEEIGRAHV